MAERVMTDAQAFGWIQRTAMNERTSMKAVAQVVLAVDEGSSA